MRKLLPALLLLLAPAAYSQTVPAVDCTQTGVQNAFNAVVAGTTTVTIPPCSAGVGWSGQVHLTIPVGSTTLSIIGAGSLTTLGGNDQTVIIDNFSSSSPLLVISTNSSPTAVVRLAGITFKGGSTGGTAKFDGMVQFNGPSQNVRFDHSHINLTTYSPGTNGSGIQFQGCMAGVTDHNIFDAGSVANMVRLFNGGTCNGDALGIGDRSWTIATAFGSAANYMYVETNTFNGSAGNDCTFGGRYVWRFNTMNMTIPAPSVQTHPTGGAGRIRGCRAIEIYKNVATAQPANYINNFFWSSSGPALVWGNTLPSSSAGGGTGYRTVIGLHNMRTDNSTYNQTATPNGWGYCGTAFDGIGSNWDGNTPSASIGYPCLDQPGRGAGDFLTGGFSSDGSGSNNVTNNATGCISSASCAYPRQALEPIYEWGDIYSPVPSNPSGIFGAATGVVANRDFYAGTQDNGTPITFTGATGVGSGTLASRPATCTAGVAYFATDQGSWNSSGSGGQGVLYKCTSTNTWTLFYTPFTYPHPLAGATVGQCTGVTSCSTVASPTAAQLLAALNSINLDNTTLTIPVGSSTITTLINYNQTNSFTLQGAGAISATTGGASTTGTDRTIFINHVAGNDPILRISTIAGKSLRITGIAFIEDSGTVNPRFNGGSLHITGHSQSVRVDHSHFTIFVGGSKGLGFNQNVTGVTDHVFINTTQTITNNIVFENGGTWNGDSGDFGNGSWSDGDHWGTSQFMFVEDTRSDGGYISDCGRAGRYVFRYSTAVNTNALFEHGTHDEFRGCREGEAYNNSFSNPNAFTDGGIVHSHSGTNLVWGNIVTNFKNAIDLGYYRTTNNNPYGLTAVPNGFGACGPVPGLGPSVWDQNATPNGYACLDQPGRGSGDLLTNFSGAFTSVLNSTTGTRIWPNQALTPVYVWNNNLGGSGPTAVVSAGISIFTNNVDYYMQFGTLGNPGSFNGTVGVGSGLLSARPATCTAGPGGNTPGVAYWATDATNPQDANHNGVLYVCNPTNTWTTYYTPYTYPHPLTGGAAPALSLSPSPVAFGNQNVSTQSAPITVTVSNTGTASEVLATPYFVISNPTEFLNTGGSCTNGGTIPAGSACTTTLAFKPSATGARTGTLTINGTVGATANLTGTGTSVAVPVVQLGPRTVNFGTVTTGTTSPTTMFTLQNTGTATLNITSIISSIPARFPISANTCGGTLAPSASCTFQAAFAPIAVGAQTATITVTTNASTNPDLINLSGTGFTPNPQPPAAPAITIMITRGAR